MNLEHFTKRKQLGTKVLLVAICGNYPETRFLEYPILNIYADVKIDPTEKFGGELDYKTLKASCSTCG